MVSLAAYFPKMKMLRRDYTQNVIQVGGMNGNRKNRDEEQVLLLQLWSYVFFLKNSFAAHYEIKIIFKRFIRTDQNLLNDLKWAHSYCYVGY